jgi:FkbM family methyltransferase
VKKRLLGVLRKPIERVPIVAESYRMVRDFVSFRASKPRPLPQGFQLIGEARRISGNYEPAQTSVITAALDQIDAFVDVGANIGYYTCLARARGVPVLAFEPNPTTLRFLYANLIANGFRDVEVVPMGLADKVDLAVFYGTGGTASLIPGWSRASQAFTTTIPTTTLDRVLAGRFVDQRLFIKIDIEGGEFACLQGARETLARRVGPTWLVESYLETVKGHRNERFGDLFRMFWDHGYTAREARPDGKSVTRDEVERWLAGIDQPADANYVFAR